ncbi:hypothetical protein C1646_430577 [Rhizophagus diaphanus]|nr:hypothetical protein C1646_430577 [Rhizophagus diaphanus] [Rhizophagus sp. MUCL 43196]
MCHLQTVSRRTFRQPNAGRLIACSCITLHNSGQTCRANVLSRGNHPSGNRAVTKKMLIRVLSFHVFPVNASFSWK